MTRKSKPFPRRQRYTRQLPLRMMPDMYDAFLEVVQPAETLSEAVRRVFQAGIDSTKNAEKASENRTVTA